MHSTKSTWGAAMLFAVLLAHPEARAEDCAPASPTCHLAKGKDLMKSDPKRAATELLESYKLDERTETLVLYAYALELDKQYALAADTWQRIITYRDSEATAAKESGNRAALVAATKGSKEATERLAALSPKVARVRIKFAAGVKPTVTRDGMEVDAMHELFVNAGQDELVFTWKDGRVGRLPVTLAAGANERFDAPEGKLEKTERIAKAEPKRKPEMKSEMKPEAKPVKPVKQPEKIQAKPEPTEDETVALVEKKPEKKPRLITSNVAGGEERERSPFMSRTGLALIAGGVIAGGVATTFGILANNDFNNAKDLGCDGNGECPIGPARDLGLRSDHRARVAQFTAIGAAALIGTGVTLWVLGRKKTHRAADVSLLVAPTSATVAWRF